MADNFYLALAAILLLPLIPAYILYKYLPAGDTDVSGPYSGLSLKLKGAFAGYFLLVLVGIGLQVAFRKSSQEKTVEQLSARLQQKQDSILLLQKQLAAASEPVVDWHIIGEVTPAGRTDTRFFYDDGTTENHPDGSFRLVKRSLVREGPATPPKWICVYNGVTGFRVVSLNRERPNNPDIRAYDIQFDDNRREIVIRRPIDINSRERDSVLAITNFAEKNPEVKAVISRQNPQLFQKAENLKLSKAAGNLQ